MGTESMIVGEEMVCDVVERGRRLRPHAEWEGFGGCGMQLVLGVSPSYKYYSNNNL